MGLVRADVLRDYPAVAKELGLDVVRQLREAGLTAAMIAQPDCLIPGDAFFRLLEQSAAKGKCPSLGLQLAEMRQLSHFGVVGLLFAHQRTPRDALQMALQYQHLLNEAVAVHLEEFGRTAVLRQEILTDVPMPSIQAIEMLVATNVQLFRIIVGAQWRPRSVHFRHSAPAVLDVHHRFFRCNCVFEDDFNGMSFPSSDLDLVNPAVDPTIASYARKFIDNLRSHDSGSPVADVRRLIYLLLPTGRATIKQVAQSLGRNTRSLQRELDRLGASFSSLLNHVRRDLVVGYLANPRFEVGHVAGLLGFMQHASFTRWFSREFGKTPTDWRHRRPK
jgi:AraC-like DNA-binding protein